MNIPTVEIPKDKKKLQQQISALEWQLTQDTNDTDRTIHTAALNHLKSASQKEGEG